MNNTIGKRLHMFVKSKHMNTTQFSKELGCGQTTMSSITSDKSKPGAEILQSITVNFPELNLRWLLIGQGDMLVGDCEKEVEKMQRQVAQLKTMFKLTLKQHEGFSDKEIDDLFNE